MSREIGYLPGAHRPAQIRAIDEFVAKAAAAGWRINRRGVEYAQAIRTLDNGNTEQISVAIYEGEMRASHVEQCSFGALDSALGWLGGDTTDGE